MVSNSLNILFNTKLSIKLPHQIQIKPKLIWGWLRLLLLVHYSLLLVCWTLGEAGSRTSLAFMFCIRPNTLAVWTAEKWIVSHWCQCLLTLLLQLHSNNCLVCEDWTSFSVTKKTLWHTTGFEKSPVIISNFYNCCWRICETWIFVLCPALRLCQIKHHLKLKPRKTK